MNNTFNGVSFNYPQPRQTICNKQHCQLLLIKISLDGNQGTGMGMRNMNPPICGMGINMMNMNKQTCGMNQPSNCAAVGSSIVDFCKDNTF